MELELSKLDLPRYHSDMSVFQIQYKMGVPQNTLFTTANSNKLPHKIEFLNNNYLTNGDASMYNNISEFYANSRIFITGATGFLGKVLVEKLLRSCDGLDSIYLLMRPKRGLAVEQRLKELFKNPVRVRNLFNFKTDLR